MTIDFDRLSLRTRADQCRFLARGMRDKRIRDRLIEIAIDYDTLARQVEDKPWALAARLANRREEVRR